MSDAGTATGTYILDIADVETKAQRLRQIFNGIRQDAAQATTLAGAGGAGGAGAAATRGGGASPAAQAADQTKIASAIERRANIEARLAQVQNTGKSTLTGLAQAEQIYAQALEKVAKDSDAALRIETQLQTVQNRIANGGKPPTLPRSLENFGPEAIDQIKSGLLGVIGPAALVTGTFGALKGTFDSFRESLNFKAELDQTAASLSSQLIGVRDSGRTFDEARAFADKYKLTQQEVNAALQASVGILRTSKAPADELLGVLARLQVASPEQGLEGAALALKELSAGSVTSLVSRFEVSRTAANKMKDEIAKGGDAVQILGKYLDDAGISADTLATRTQGVAGALNDVRVAQEELKIAQGDLAASQGGLLFVDVQTRVYRGLANLLNGEVVNGLRATGIEFVAQQKASEAYTNAIAAGKTETEAAAEAQRIYNLVQQVGREQQGLVPPVVEQESKVRRENTAAIAEGTVVLSEEAQKKLDSAIAASTLSSEQSRIEASSKLAAVGLLGAGDQAVLLAQKYNLATNEARFLIAQQQQLGQARADADQRAGERSGGQFNTVAQQSAFANNQRAQAQAARDAAQAQARYQQTLGNTGPILAYLQNQLKGTVKGSKEYYDTLNQIASIEKSTGKTRVSAAQTTGLQLAQTEENSQAAILKAQREGQERLADSAADFALSRSRKEEDEAIKIRRLLASGQRAAAAREREDFTRQQQRDQEDFNIQRQRTLRNNAESTSDIDNRTDLRQQQIGDRAALRGVRPASGAVGAGGIPAPPPSIPNAPAASTQPILLRVQIAPTQVQIDGHTIVDLTWPEFEQRIDAELADELSTIGIILPPGGGQTAVAGPRS